MARVRQEDHASVRVRCPFWLGYIPKYNRIRCEGYSSDYPRLSEEIALPNRKERESYARSYCEQHYEKCPMFMTIMDNKYNDKERDA